MESAMATTRGLYDSVTASIVKSLEAGVKPWSQPWTVKGTAGVSLVPVNAATGRPYSGMNVLLLWGAAIEKGWPHGWMTFNQANAQGGRVRKGEKSTTVIYTKFTEKEVEGADKPKLVPMLKAYSVFNLAQLDGLPASFYVPPSLGPRKPA
jgi:antirestriction protein ArdC